MRDDNIMLSTAVRENVSLHDVMEWALCGGALEEGRLRGALEDVEFYSDIRAVDDGCRQCGKSWCTADAALRAPTLEEGER